MENKRLNEMVMSINNLATNLPPVNAHNLHLSNNAVNTSRVLQKDA